METDSVVLSNHFVGVVDKFQIAVLCGTFIFPSLIGISKIVRSCRFCVMAGNLL